MKNELINFYGQSFSHKGVTDALMGDKIRLKRELTSFSLSSSERERKAKEAVETITLYNPQNVLLSRHWLVCYTSLMIPLLRAKGINVFYFVQDWEKEAEKGLTTA